MSNDVSNHVKSSFVPICHNCGVVCFSYGKYEHKAYSCYLSRSNTCNVYEKIKWIPKYVNANFLGPKQVWVSNDQT